MVGTRRLELLTFPACRDALFNNPINQILDRSMGFPRFYLELAAASFSESWMIL